MLDGAPCVAKLTCGTFFIGKLVDSVVLPVFATALMSQKGARRSMKYLTILIALAVTFASTQEASALAEFKKAFEKKYSSEISKNKDLKTAVKKAGCYLCHVKKPAGFQGKVGKDAQNEYGMLLNKLVQGNAKERKAKAKDEDKAKVKAEVLAEFTKALDKVAEVKSNGGKGPKFGEMMKAGKIPIDVKEASAKYLASLKKKKATAEDAEAKKPDNAAKDDKAAS